MRKYLIDGELLAHEDNCDYIIVMKQDIGENGIYSHYALKMVTCYSFLQQNDDDYPWVVA